MTKNVTFFRQIQQIIIFLPVFMVFIGFYLDFSDVSKYIKNIGNVIIHNRSYFDPTVLKKPELFHFVCKITCDS